MGFTFLRVVPPPVKVIRLEVAITIARKITLMGKSKV
jgi:hypothetical protein